MCLMPRVDIASWYCLPVTYIRELGWLHVTVRATTRCSVCPKHAHSLQLMQTDVYRHTCKVKKLYIYTLHVRVCVSVYHMNIRRYAERVSDEGCAGAALPARMRLPRALTHSLHMCVYVQGSLLQPDHCSACWCVPGPDVASDTVSWACCVCCTAADTA